MRYSTFFDIAGVVAVELINATDSEISMVTRQIGSPDPSCRRPPDVTVEFVPEFDLTSAKVIQPEQYVVISKNEFLVRDAQRRAYTAIDFSEIGGRCHLRCERGTSSVPFLIAVVALRALAKGYAPLHASAFRYKSKGVLVAGWSKSGKTEAMLAFAAKGAEYVGDEWLLISPSDRVVFGIPEQVRLWNAQIAQARQLGLDLNAVGKHPFTGIRFALSVLRNLRSLTRGALRRRIDQLEDLLARQCNLQLPPNLIFPRTAPGFRSSLDHVALLVPHMFPTVEIDEIPVEVAIRHFATSVHFELQRLFAAYLAFRYAFPGRCNPLLEHFEDTQCRILSRALRGCQVLRVLHPYPARLDVLAQTIESVISIPHLPLDAGPSAATEAEMSVTPAAIN